MWVSKRAVLIREQHLFKAWSLLEELRYRKMVQESWQIYGVYFKGHSCQNQREKDRERERKTERVKTVTLAAITLHNWLREVSKNWKIYIPKGFIDHENIEVCEIFEVFWRADDVQGSWYPMSLSRSGNHSTNHVRELSEEYSEYFMNKGCVQWQQINARVDFQVTQRFFIPIT